MKNITMTEIKHFEDSLEILNEVVIEIDLNSILVEEYAKRLASEINSIV